MAGVKDTEEAGLMASSMKKDQQKPDWSRFGLKEEPVEDGDPEAADNDVFEHHADSEKNELFAQDQSSKSAPWWKTTFFVSEPVLFGTWDGVFTSCMITIFGIVIFLRTGWMVGNAGIGYSVLIILITITVALVAALSAIGVCERCSMQSGGVYFLLSHVLGARIGASVGILYCFGQAVACSLYVVGFGESIAALFHQDNVWIARGIGAAVLLLLLGINVAGVKWVIRVQLVLLLVLLVAVLDFLIGSFSHTDVENGFVGYSGAVLSNNTHADYQEGESFFTVFGVFFPTATGVFAGINMSGDLKKPSRNIPIGTLSAVGVSTLLYLLFALVLASTCMRDALQVDYMIAEKVSLLGVLFLAGLYVSSVSSCMGGLYGSPRILQCIANENVIPLMRVFGQGRGANKVPVYALILVTIVSLIFICIGQVNTLGPIVTMPFLLTYLAVDYAYFALAMSYDKKKAREDRYSQSAAKHEKLNGDMTGVSSTHAASLGVDYGTIDRKNSDLDNLFPERVSRHEHGELKRQDSLGSPTFYAEPASEVSETTSVVSETTDDTAKLIRTESSKKDKDKDIITSQPRSFYSIFCNRWLSLFGAVASFVLMFAIQWAYALANISVMLIVYIYIGQANPGVFPGIAEFSIIQWIRDSVTNCCRRGPPPPEQIVVNPNTPAMNTMAAQLTEDNEDFAERGRYHQSEVLEGDNFQEYVDTD